MGVVLNDDDDDDNDIHDNYVANGNWIVRGLPSALILKEI